MARQITIGCGSAFDGDPLLWGVELAESGLVSYMAFDCLAERSTALAQYRRRADENAGQDTRVAYIAELYAPFLGRGGRVVGNFGAANPDAAGSEVVATLGKMGLTGTRVGVIRGDDVYRDLLDANAELPELGCRARDVEDQIIGANAYIGAEPIVALLDESCAFVLGGRLADPSCYVGPICFELGWALDDWHRVGVATAAGHLCECSVHVTGGNFADPPMQIVPDLHNLGVPMAVVSDDEDIVITKLEGTGGVVNRRTIAVQLIYEVHDPAAYLTPDVTADFSQVTVEEIGKDRMLVRGADGRSRPDTLRVVVGLDRGWNASYELSFGGPGCVERARLAGEVAARRLEGFGDDVIDSRVDIVGLNSLYGEQMTSGYPSEVRMRMAARCSTKEAADEVARESSYMVFAVAGTGRGAGPAVAPAIGATPAYVPRDAVSMEWEVLET